ncbi:MAG: MFS transporter, partial [Deltaproteobacteria bacterium]|nr:MFS transporter [Deltaproteobacteria bacterium]
MKASNFDQPIQKKMATLYSRQFFILWIANFFVVMSLGSFFLFPLFITQNGGSKSDIGILMGAMMLSSVLFRPWVSQMVDHFGRKRIFSLGTLILIGVPAAHILFEGDISGYYSLLVVARIVHGIGISIGFTAAYTFISDIVPDSRLNEGLGIFGLNGLIGIAVG